MLKKVFIPALILLFLISCSHKGNNDDASDIMSRLNALEHVEAKEIQPYHQYPSAFQIDILQPLDHNNPGNEKFWQRLYLHHKDESLPMIVYTAGYSSNESQFSELLNHIEANHLVITHRYFDGAKPQIPINWKFLTIRQAAADVHRIITLFKSLYPNKWISTGRSKSGMTALFHRRFFPDDVSATVTFVAPIHLGVQDLRVEDFLKTQVLDDAGRQKIKDFQRALLENRKDIVPFLRDRNANTYNLVYSIGLNMAFEFSVLEFWFAFLYGTDAITENIPDANEHWVTMLHYLEEVVNIWRYSDWKLPEYEPYMVQAFTELGWYSYIMDHLADLLIDVDENAHMIQLPEGVDPAFKPEVMEDMLHWLQTMGNNIIYIYGENDPFTAAAVYPGSQTNALQVIQSNGNHYIALEDLDDRDLILSTLKRWLGISVSREPVRQIKDGTIAPLGL